MSAQNLIIYKFTSLYHILEEVGLDLNFSITNVDNENSLKDKVKKEKLKQYCLDQSAARTAQELIVCIARMDTWKKNKNKIIHSLKSNKSTPTSAVKYKKK